MPVPEQTELTVASQRARSEADLTGVKQRISRHSTIKHWRKFILIYFVIAVIAAIASRLCASWIDCNKNRKKHRPSKHSGQSEEGVLGTEHPIIC